MIEEAIEMLMVLGKFDQAARILKGRKSFSGSKYNLEMVIKLQAAAAKSQNDFKLALELYLSIREYEEAVKILVNEKKTQDLMNLVRQLENGN